MVCSAVSKANRAAGQQYIMTVAAETTPNVGHLAVGQQHKTIQIATYIYIRCELTVTRNYLDKRASITFYSFVLQ